MHQQYYTFIICNYFHTPFMLAKYDTVRYELLTKDQNVHSVLLSSVHLRSASLQLSRGVKDGVNGSSN